MGHGSRSNILRVHIAEQLIVMRTCVHPGNACRRGELRIPQSPRPAGSNAWLSPTVGAAALAQHHRCHWYADFSVECRGQTSCDFRLRRSRESAVLPSAAGITIINTKTILKIILIILIAGAHPKQLGPSDVWGRRTVRPEARKALQNTVLDTTSSFF